MRGNLSFILGTFLIGKCNYQLNHKRLASYDKKGDLGGDSIVLFDEFTFGGNQH